MDDTSQAARIQRLLKVVRNTSIANGGDLGVSSETSDIANCADLGVIGERKPRNRAERRAAAKRRKRAGKN